MAAITAFLDFMPHTVTVAPFSAIDGYGQATYGAAVSYKARIQGPVKFLHQATQQERVSSQTVYVGSTAAISSKDKLTLPSGFDVTAVKILQVDPVSDENVLMFSVLYCG